MSFVSTFHKHIKTIHAYTIIPTVRVSHKDKRKFVKRMDIGRMEIYARRVTGFQITVTYLI